MDSEVSATARYTAFALSIHMSERGDSCFPSLETLRAEMRCSKRSIITGIRELEASGWLVVARAKKGEGGPGRRAVNRYRASFPKGFTAEPFFSEKGFTPPVKGFTAEPEVVKDLEDVKKPLRSRASRPAPKPGEQRPVNMPTSDPVGAIQRMIQNGAITNPLDLDAELRASVLTAAQKNFLRDLIPRVASDA